ncbi:MAG: hypothetical protein ACI9VR_005107 [Cognaticolwellia sp.]|jgi:hypothetical protein
MRCSLPRMLSVLLIGASLAHGFPEDTQWDPEEGLRSVVALRSGPSLCAGVVVNPQGQVATAYHCVAGAKVRVQTRDGQSFSASIVASDSRQDIALLDVPGLSGHPWSEMAGEKARVGETAWALGHPFGSATEQSASFSGLLMWSASKGVVSGVGERWVQVDTPVNPGNSGGPIVNDRGQIIGIASRKLDGDGVAFAAPVAALQDLMESPEHRLLGGSYGAGLDLWMPLELDQAPSLGGHLQADLRDRLVLSLGAAAGLDRRWRAVSRSEAISWTSGVGMVSGRVRLGHGVWSTSFDLGVGGILLSSQLPPIEGSLTTRPGPLSLQPAAQLQVEVAGGASFRVLATQGSGETQVTIGMGWAWPGRVGVW